MLFWGAALAQNTEESRGLKKMLSDLDGVNERSACLKFHNLHFWTNFRKIWRYYG